MAADEGTAAPEGAKPARSLPTAARLAADEGRAAPEGARPARSLPTAARQGMCGETAAPTGIARRRREQQRRAAGRKVAWLTGMLQQTSSHHMAFRAVGTEAAEQTASLKKEVQELSAQVATLERLVSDFVGRAAEPFVVGPRATQGQQPHPHPPPTPLRSRPPLRWKPPVRSGRSRWPPWLRAKH